MIDSTHIARFNEAWISKKPADALYALAVSLRDEGVAQINVYLLFDHFLRTTDVDDARYDAIPDNMDLICGGPWAKGHDLFPTELTGDDIRRHKGLPPLDRIPPPYFVHPRPSNEDPI